MFERLTSKLLQRMLQEYFVMDDKDNVMDVWSGFVRWNQLELRKEWLNEKIQAKGLPFEVLHGYVNLLTVSIPWSKLSSKKKDKATAGTIVIVLDGVQLLVRTKFDFDDEALEQARVNSRRRDLKRSDKASRPSSPSSSSWADSLRQRLKEGILPQIADNVQVHIRDLHIRLEDISSSPSRPMAFGIVLESMHIQHSTEAQKEEESTLVQKESQFNHFAIYANALDPESSPGKPSERSILQRCSRQTIIEVLDGSIPRRANSLEATTRMAPQHTYILSPVDATADLRSGTDPAVLVNLQRPVMLVSIQVPSLRMSLQDVHCHAVMSLNNAFQDHKYKAKYRPYRPQQSVRENSRAWWQYAVAVIHHELRQSHLRLSWRRFQKGYKARKRYCDLYERRLRAGSVENGNETFLPAEEEELQAIEDGRRGELTVDDIVLYRLIVKMRVGGLAKSRKSQPSTSWLQRKLSGMVQDDASASDEFHRAVDLWEEEKRKTRAPLEESTSWVAITVEFCVDQGILSAYAPLGSTVDQTASKRLQMQFLSFIFTDFRTSGQLLGDFESVRVDSSLQDFRAEEKRTDQTRHTVVERDYSNSTGIFAQGPPVPFMKCEMLKNSKRTTDFHIGLHIAVQKLVVALEPGCEWIRNGRYLLRPLPQFSKLKDFWGDVGMAFINSIGSEGREILAKAETAVADHKSIDIDVWIDCPRVRISNGDSNELVVDFGQARIRTERLAGVAKSRLLSTLKDEARRLADVEETNGYAGNSIDHLQANSSVNLSLRSGHFNDELGGLQTFRDDMAALDHLAHTSGESSDGIESFFYDTYVADMKFGCVQLSTTAETFDIVDPVDIRVKLQRSIIPRDATLFRFKMFYSVGGIVLSAAREEVTGLRDLALVWLSAFDSDSIGSRANLDKSVHGGRVGIKLENSIRTRTQFSAVSEVAEPYNEFDEDEFFDTMEQESALLDVESAMEDDNFMAESESVLSDSQSRAKSIRSRRRRQASISDVSSEGSFSKRRGLVDHPYLDADNLARLEENADEDGLEEFEDRDSSEDESFRSAVSSGQVFSLIKDLEDDMKETTSSLSRLKTKLAEFRSPENYGGSGDGVQRLKVKNALQIEIERIRAELMAMTATRDDLRVGLTTVTSSAKSVSREATLSVERASLLLQTRKKRGSVGIEQSLAGSSTRNTLQVSGTVDSILLRFRLGRDEEEIIEPCFWTCLTNGSIVLVVKSGERKLFFSAESLVAGVTRDGNEESSHVFIGGNVDDYSRSLLASRFPNVVLSCPVDQKLLRLSFTFGKASANGENSPNQVVRMRLAIGDFQVSPRPLYVQEVQAFLSQFKADRGEESQLHSMKRTETSSPKSFYYDVMVTMYSGKLLDGDTGSVAVIVSDITARASGTVAPHIYKERSQLDLRLGGIQLLRIGENSMSPPLEVFRKDEAYLPLVRLRARAQKILPWDEVSWVVGKPTPKPLLFSGPGITRGAVWSVHSSIQVGPTTVLLCPEAIDAVFSSFKSWQRIMPRRNQGSTNVAGYSGLRWRVDAVVRKLSVEAAQSLEDLASDDISTKRVVSSLGLTAALQSVSNEAGGLSARIRLSDIGLHIRGDQSAILKSFSISGLFDQVQPGNTVEHRAKPFMTAPAGVPWILKDESFALPVLPATEDDASNQLLTILASPCELRLTPKSVGFLLVTGLKLVRVLQQKDVAKRKPREVATRKKRRLQICLDRLQFACYDNSPVTLSRHNIPQFLLSTVGARLVLREKGSGTFVKIQVSELEGVDFSHRPGIRSFGRLSHTTSRLKHRTTNDSEGAMLELAADFIRQPDLTYTTKVHMYCGSIQVLLLPSFLRSMLSFNRDLLSSLDQVEHKTSSNRGIGSVLENTGSTEMSLVVDSLEVIVPTRDIPRHLRESGDDDVGVMMVRCGVECRLSLTADEYVDLISSNNVAGHSFEQNVRTSFEEFVSRRLSQCESGKVARSSSEILLHEFQILRTAMSSPTTSSPLVFDTTVSSVREQRVTNSFSFAFRHELVATRLETESRVGRESAKIDISQAFDLKAEFIDVLVYIARSDRGINNAIDSTLRPISSLIKGDGKIKESETQTSLRSSALHLMAMSTSVFSFRIEGIQVTFVPGGATRLTESPIIKFTLFRIAAGSSVAGKSSPPNLRVVSSTDLAGLNTESQRDHRHLLVAAWLSCEVSAYYHNRRLVEWEPFIEPWCFVVRLGGDLMRALNLPPLATGFDDFPTNKADSSKQAIQSPVSRLGHWSRLLRSPFGTSNGDIDTPSKAGPIFTDSDVCILLLHARIPEVLDSAIFPVTGESTVALLPFFPGEQLMKWLVMHGYPSRQDDDPAILCQVSDEGLLDVNVTGALIDTLWQFLSKKDDKETAPHLIKNDSGLTLRFEEVLDNDRVALGGRAPKVTLGSGASTPLSLRRSLSQSCDPHKAYIVVELGTFDETIGRVGPEANTPPRGSRSTAFSYRISSKVPVDTVGINRYPLELNGDRGSQYGTDDHLENIGWIVVKVRLEGGLKVVSVESPVSLSNTSDRRLFFEMREKDGVSVLWRSYLDRSVPGGSVPVPADLAMSTHAASSMLFIVAMSDEEEKYGPMTIRDDHVEEVKMPPQFSQSSLSRGVISEADTSVRMAGNEPFRNLRHFNVCSLRVGSIAQRDAKEPLEVPEQRMIVFRSSILFRNHLALPVELQARTISTGRNQASFVSLTDLAAEEGKESREWTMLGRLDCGDFLSWSGASPWETLQVRFRFVEQDGGVHRQFPSWSSLTDIPPERSTLTAKTKKSAASRSSLQTVTFLDCEHRPLVVSVSLTQGSALTEKASSQTMEAHLHKLHSSGRVVGIFVPFWIIDQTGLDLQFRSGGFIAGQESSHLPISSGPEEKSTMGLGELLDDRNMSHLPSRIPFRVLMIGDQGSSFVNVRMGKDRVNARQHASWSTPVYLPKSGRGQRDTVVVSPVKATGDTLSSEENVKESFVVRSRTIEAPDQYGGSYGTKLLPIVCKYVILNNLNHDIEIISGTGKDNGCLVVKADSQPRPLSFTSGQMRFRPKEFGWNWSGRFSITLSRKDITLRLRHGLKGYTMIASVEIHPGETSGTCVIVFRRAMNAPYRIENHTMFPIMYFQRNPFSQPALARSHSARDQQDSVILPYHSASFAWDEPEDMWRSVGIQLADFGLLPSDMNQDYLGSFDLDRLSPGSEVQLAGDNGMVGKIIAEGPTRILRITGVTTADTSSQLYPTKSRAQQADLPLIPSISAQIRLKYGVGLSVVDWTPQELLYIHLHDISVETHVDKGKETTSFSIGYAAINNQLWVTPYPVALSVGSRVVRRRHRKYNALGCSWTRSVSHDDTFDGLTLLGKVEVVSEPIDVHIDGRLAILIVEMIQQSKALIGTGRSTKPNLADGTSGGGSFKSDFLSPARAQLDLADELYSGLDFMATTTIAAKLRHNYRPIPRPGNRKGKQLKGSPAPSFLKSKHKFYIERIKLSVTSAELSWHGFLPVASLIRPALFFEGFPIFMRPYTASHVYGSVGDLLKNVLSHYVSVRRLVDVGIGALLRKPLFLPRELLTYMLSSAASTLQVAERSLAGIAHASLDSTTKGSIYTRIIFPFATFNAAFLRTGVNILQAGSSIVRYGSVTPRPTGTQLRSRNPRFFAHVDGNDLLVEYVEGENAGKALLSRVRMGAHLIEGYSFHVDEVYESRLVGGTLEMDGKALILMATHDRLMLLRGQLDDNFCNVVWETTFNDIAHVEYARMPDLSHNLFTIWYARDYQRGHDDSEDMVPRSVARRTSGLGMLLPMNIFVSRENTRHLLENLQLVV